MVYAIIWFRFSHLVGIREIGNSQKWRVEKCQDMKKQFEIKSGKNSSGFSYAFQLARKLQEGEVLVLFDVKNFFGNPTRPVEDDQQQSGLQWKG